MRRTPSRTRPIAQYVPTRSAMRSDRARPPHRRAGTSTPSNPSSPHRLISDRAVAQSFCSSRSSAGSTSCSANVAAVWAISRCSSVRRSGVKRGRRRAIQQPRAAECRWACRGHDIRSNMPAAPMPPPTHIVTSPYRAPRRRQLVHEGRRQLRAGAAQRDVPARLRRRSRSECGGRSAAPAGRRGPARRTLRSARPDRCLPGRDRRASEDFLHRRYRANAKALRLDACGRVTDEPCERRRPSVRARSASMTTSAAAPSLICDELPAVTVPAT